MDGAKSVLTRTFFSSIPCQILDHLSCKALAIIIDLPMAGAPAFEKTVKIGPGQRKKLAPFPFDLGCVDMLLTFFQSNPQFTKVGVKQPAFQLFTVGFRETTADEIGHILHATAPAHILKIDRRHLPAIGRKTEVCQLGIAMNKGLKTCLFQRPVDQRCTTAAFKDRSVSASSSSGWVSRCQ